MGCFKSLRHIMFGLCEPHISQLIWLNLLIPLIALISRFLLVVIQVCYYWLWAPPMTATGRWRVEWQTIGSDWKDKQVRYMKIVKTTGAGLLQFSFVSHIKSYFAKAFSPYNQFPILQLPFTTVLYKNRKPPISVFLILSPSKYDLCCSRVGAK